MTEPNALICNVVDGIATLTINRPEKLNALNSVVFAELDRAITRVASDPQIAALIITGAGSRAFCAGADLDELAGMMPWDARAYIQRGQSIISRLDSLEKPTIAAIDGYALGGGCEIALACHLRVASTAARLGLPEARTGMIPGYGGTQRLSRLVGQAKALELTMTGEFISGEEAHRIGLVNRVVASEELLSTARELAAKTQQMSAVSIRLTLTAIRRGLEMPLAEGLELEADLDALTFGSPDQQEGLRAFVERRKPVWPSRKGAEPSSARS